MNPFQFSLDSLVEIAASGETGHVIARSEYVRGENMYLVRYRNAQGLATEQWWAESALNFAR